MDLPVNRLKQALRDRQPQIGFWLSLGDPTSAEICAGAGFDWLLIDGEHTAHGAHSLLAQLRAIQGYPGTQAAARVPSADPVTIKQYLDLGVQTLLVPMIESAEQAKAVVRACRYPPAGERGVGGARAARWGQIPDYLHQANEQIAIVVQVETRAGLDQLDSIAGVEGVDGVFLGPADLAASLGWLGQPAHPQIKGIVLDAVKRIAAAGKAPGILTRDESFARSCLDHGALMVGVGLDAHLLAAQTQVIVRSFKPGPRPC